MTKNNKECLLKNFRCDTLLGMPFKHRTKTSKKRGIKNVKKKEPHIRQGVVYILIVIKNRFIYVF